MSACGRLRQKVCMHEVGGGGVTRMHTYPCDYLCTPTAANGVNQCGDVM